MKDSLRKITNQKPYIYGGLYFCLIPIYAVLYAILPDSSLKLTEQGSDFYTDLYFSIITITTLGYGDITPITKMGKFLTASEASFGMILVGLFLNSLSHQHGIEVQKIEKEIQEQKSKTQDRDRFIAFNQLIDLKIKRYMIYSIPITTPLDQRTPYAFRREFQFNDMRDLFYTTSRLNDDSSRPAVDYYFQSLYDLLNSLEELVKFGYIQRWPDFEKICLEFFEVAKKYDFSEAILNAPKLHISEFCAEMIENHEGEVQFLDSNIINSYVALYFLLNESFEFIDKYSNMATKIIND